jgi:hypothetical protein
MVTRIIPSDSEKLSTKAKSSINDGRGINIIPITRMINKARMFDWLLANLPTSASISRGLILLSSFSIQGFK